MSDIKNLKVNKETTKNKFELKKIIKNGIIIGTLIAVAPPILGVNMADAKSNNKSKNEVTSSYVESANTTAKQKNSTKTKKKNEEKIIPEEEKEIDVNWNLKYKETFYGSGKYELKNKTKYDYIDAAAFDPENYDYKIPTVNSDGIPAYSCEEATNSIFETMDEASEYTILLDATRYRGDEIKEVYNYLKEDNFNVVYIDELDKLYGNEKTLTFSFDNIDYLHIWGELYPNSDYKSFLSAPQHLVGDSDVLTLITLASMNNTDNQLNYATGKQPGWTPNRPCNIINIGAYDKTNEDDYRTLYEKTIKEKQGYYTKANMVEIDMNKEYKYHSRHLATTLEQALGRYIEYKKSGYLIENQPLLYKGEYDYNQKKYTHNTLEDAKNAFDTDYDKLITSNYDMKADNKYKPNMEIKNVLKNPMVDKYALFSDDYAFKFRALKQNTLTR